MKKIIENKNVIFLKTFCIIFQCLGSTNGPDYGEECYSKDEGDD